MTEDFPDANRMQVGGNHYKTNYEHWDWVLDHGDTGPTYLVGVATKYVARWRKKGGVEDLKKALHYVNKLIENRTRIRWRKMTMEEVRSIGSATSRMGMANGLSPQEADFCYLLMCMRDPDDLFQARELLLAIIENADPLPVPLEDSNKHADRDYGGAVTGRMPGVPHGE